MTTQQMYNKLTWDMASRRDNPDFSDAIYELDRVTNIEREIEREAKDRKEAQHV